MSPATFSRDEMMCVAASRMLGDGSVCFVGIGLPSTAANLARLTHAPDIVLIYESGTIGAKPDVLPLSIGDPGLAEHAESIVSIPEIFTYWLQGGRIDVGFLGAAQIDRYGNLNTTVIGPYRQPRVRLPGAGGAPEIACHAAQTLVVLKQTPRTFVERLDFCTSRTARSEGRRRGGLAAVITDLGVLRPAMDDGELELDALYPGVTVEMVTAATGWPLRIAETVSSIDPPTEPELRALRELQARSAEAHARTPNLP